MRDSSEDSYVVLRFGPLVLGEFGRAECIILKGRGDDRVREEAGKYRISDTACMTYGDQCGASAR